MMSSFAALVTVAKREIGSMMSRQVHVMAAYGVAGISGAGFGIMALVSLHRFIAQEAGAFYADAAIAGVFLVFLVAALIYARAERARRRTPSEIRRQIMLAAPVVARVAVSKPKIALAGMVAAALLGVLTGRSIR